MIKNPEPFPIILAIDPSMSNLGWAAHNLNLGFDRYDIESPAWRFGLIHPRPRQREPQFQWGDAYAQLRNRLGNWHPTHFASEWPTFFDSVKGKIAAQKGYTIDLAGMTAYIAGRLGVRTAHIELWKPIVWKGSVPKHVTQQKFIRLYGKPAEFIARHNSDDVVDAIMIAEYWLTLYHREKFRWLPQWKEKTMMAHYEEEQMRKEELP